MKDKIVKDNWFDKIKSSFFTTTGSTGDIWPTWPNMDDWTKKQPTTPLVSDKSYDPDLISTTYGTTFGGIKSAENKLKIEAEENGYVVTVDPENLNVKYVFGGFEEVLDWIKENFKNPEKGREFIKELNNKKNPNTSWTWSDPISQAASRIGGGKNNPSSWTTYGGTSQTSNSGITGGIV